MMDDFHARIRTQDWYHGFSEQESEEETVIRSVARIEGQDTNGENQPRAENRPHLVDAEQGITRPSAEYRDKTLDHREY